MPRFKSLLVKQSVFPSKRNPLVPRDKHYFDVYLFEQPEAMWAAAIALTKHREEPAVKGFTAITIPYERLKLLNDEVHRAPKIGNILFYKGRITPECISHEAFHAAIAYTWFLDLLSFETIDDEEKIAYSVSSLTHQIHEAFSGF